MHKLKKANTSAIYGSILKKQVIQNNHNPFDWSIIWTHSVSSHAPNSSPSSSGLMMVLTLSTAPWNEFSWKQQGRATTLFPGQISADSSCVFFNIVHMVLTIIMYESTFYLDPGWVSTSYLTAVALIWPLWLTGHKEPIIYIFIDLSIGLQSAVDNVHIFVFLLILSFWILPTLT